MSPRRPRAVSPRTTWLVALLALCLASRPATAQSASADIGMSAMVLALGPVVSATALPSSPEVAVRSTTRFAVQVNGRRVDDAGCDLVLDIGARGEIVRVAHDHAGHAHAAQADRATPRALRMRLAPAARASAGGTPVHVSILFGLDGAT